MNITTKIQRLDGLVLVQVLVDGSHCGSVCVASSTNELDQPILDQLAEGTITLQETIRLLGFREERD